MGKTADSPQDVIDAILEVARQLKCEPGCAPSRKSFTAHPLGMKERQVVNHFPGGYNDAVSAAGLTPNRGGKQSKIKEADLLQEYGRVVRQLRAIPTGPRFDSDGKYSRSVYSGTFGKWSLMPGKFREFAIEKPEWSDVVALLPIPAPARVVPVSIAVPIDDRTTVAASLPRGRHSRLDGRSTYGNPIDFRGLRHEPVNEQGVVFLFGMVAKELGYMIEAVQQGYPDCEAKRQIGPGKWQRVRIEFEFESNRFNHDPSGCDVIVCWRHNWPECPLSIEVVELASEIKTLSTSTD